MARDTELDRLKGEQDLAFNRKQRAYEAMDAAWKQRSAARERLDRAHAAKQSAYELQDAAWQSLQRLRDYNGPRIESLNSQQETAYQNMRDAFDRASSAYRARDGASAASYAADGRRYKQESQDCVAERRRLVQELRDARDRHEGTKLAFQRAKAYFDRAVQVFKARLEKVRAESKRRQSDKRFIAERAGVPYQYLDDVYVSRQGGVYNIYFGGVGKPNGPGHGHYVMDQNWNVTYQRDPFGQHGGQNFTDAQQDYHNVIDDEAGSGGEFGFWCKFRGFNAFAESNTNRQGRPKIDIYYGPNGPFGPAHHHAVAYRETPHTFVYDEYRS